MAVLSFNSAVKSWKENALVKSVSSKYPMYDMELYEDNTNFSFKLIVSMQSSGLGARWKTEYSIASEQLARISKDPYEVLAETLEEMCQQLTVTMGENVTVNCWHIS